MNVVKDDFGVLPGSVHVNVDARDRELADKVAGGTTDERNRAFEGIIDRYGKSILKVFRDAGLVDRAEDLAQDTFLRVFRYIHSFNPDQPFKAWLFQIARNVLRDEFARKRRRTEAEEQAAKPELAEALIRGDDSQEFRRRVEAALEQYSGKRAATVFRLRMDGLRNREIAKRLGIAERTVSSYLVEVRKWLLSGPLRSDQY